MECTLVERGGGYSEPFAHRVLPRFVGARRVGIIMCAGAYATRGNAAYRLGRVDLTGLAARLALGLVCVSVPTVHAQPRPDAGQVLEQTREPLRTPSPEPAVLRREPPPPAFPASPSLKVKVQEFVFRGNSLYSDAALRNELEDFVGEELDFEGLNEAATRVRAFYRARGYFLAQAYLPVQTIRNGRVEIEVIEGRVGRVELERRQGARFAESLLAGVLRAHLKQGQIITESGLERPLLIINDLPGAQVTSEIRPSETLGAADVRVNVLQEGGRFNGYVDADNHGNRFTGEYRIGTNLNWNTPLGYGDQATFRGFVSDEGMRYMRFAYLIPVGYYGTRVGLSYSSFEYRLTKDFSELRASGEGEVKSAYAFHPLVRTRNSNVIAQVSYDDKHLIDRTATSFEERDISTLKLGVVGDFRDGFLGGGLNAYGATMTQGRLRIEPPSVLATDVGPTGHNTSGSFVKYNFEARRLQRISDRTSVLFSVSGQCANKSLASAEKFSLGGPNGVRAFPVGEATADSALLATVEGRHIVPTMKIFGGDLTLLGFYDQGWARINETPLASDNENSRSLSGYGVGASAGHDGRFLLRANVAWKMRGVAQSDPAPRVPRIWVQAVKWF
ncbi:MAG: ShlB/FhaC/HecB family hemolysin secretion/activation protein [Burkholderiales bacterium]